MIIILLIAYLARLNMVSDILFWIPWWFVFVVSVLDNVFDLIDRRNRHKRGNTPFKIK